MDKDLQKNRNYYLSAVGYLNAAMMLSNAYKAHKIEESSIHVIQIWPLYYLFSLSAEMALKAGLILHGVKYKQLTKRETGHNLSWLADQYLEKVSKINPYLESMIRDLNKGEFRYTEFCGGGAHVTVINQDKFFPLLQELIQKDHDEALKRLAA